MTLVRETAHVFASDNLFQCFAKIMFGDDATRLSERGKSIVDASTIELLAFAVDDAGFRCVRGSCRPCKLLIDVQNRSFRLKAVFLHVLANAFGIQLRIRINEK